MQLYDTRISTKLEEVYHLKELVTKVTPTLKDDIVCGGSAQDRLAEAVTKIVDLEREIDRDIDRYIAAKQEVSGILDKLTDPDQLQVLHMRYAQYKTWEQIACDMNMTYRNVCYIHGKGLQAVNEIMKGEKTSKFPPNC